MTISPKVSVLLTSYNHAKYLRETIDSVLNQTFKDFELIIWDDASTDESWAIIQSYTDLRIRVFRNEINQAGVINVNKAISEEARGEYVAMHHSDDIWEPQKLEKQVAFLDSHPDVGAVFTKVKLIDEDGSLLTDSSHPYHKVFDQPNRTRFEWLNRFFYISNALCHPSVLIRKSCYEECGVYRYGFAQLPDFDMWVRLCLKYEIYILPECLVRFRIRDNEANTSGDRPEVHVRLQFELLQSYSNYLSIIDKDEFLKVFPASFKYLNDKDFDISFALAMMALSLPHPSGKLFGLQILFDLINDPIKARKIKDIYGFSYSEFIKLTAKHDVFSIISTELANELSAIKSSRSWSIYNRLSSFLQKIFPLGSPQHQLFNFAWISFREIRKNGPVSFLKKADVKIRSAIWMAQRRKPAYRKKSSDTYIDIETVSAPEKIAAPDCLIEIIICVHNALEDVQICLETIEKHTSAPYQLIIVDDGSFKPTEEYLKSFVAGKEHCTLLRNEKANGYTRAANKGLRSSTAEFIVLLNSDTIVGPEWLSRLYAAIISNDRYGVAGPLSNTASWQSVPKLEDDGDWAINPLPDSMSAEQMCQNIKDYSGMLRPDAKLLNGFCMMIRRAVIDDIGYFDEDLFGEGYGEEDDFNLRARNAGWKLVIADDVYIYHAQSKSYSHERRHQLYERAGKSLRNKHGVGIISESVQYMQTSRVMEGIRARSAVITDRIHFLEQGRKEFSGKKVLFVLPIKEAGGGGNVVVDEARSMREMGVDVTLFNLTDYKEEFLRSYPHLDIPMIFGVESSLVHHSIMYDAIIATANHTVEWLKPVKERYKHQIFGYYVQGFEVLMYDEGSRSAQRALASYSLIRGMKLFTKTEWVRNTVLKHTGIDSANIGISVNIDLFRSRHPRPLGQKPVVVTAMIRSGSPYRSPKLTMNVLRKLEHHFKEKVDIRLFGADDIRNPILGVPTNFSWTQAGKLTQQQVPNFLSDADIFVDFSSHQAMGLTALEAMASGCAVIVPQNGGAVEFVRDRENGIVVDTSNEESCYNALKLIVANDTLRKNIQLSAIRDTVQYFPEAVGYNILKYLFKAND